MSVALRTRTKRDLRLACALLALGCGSGRPPAARPSAPAQLAKAEQVAQSAVQSEPAPSPSERDARTDAAIDGGTDAAAQNDVTAVLALDGAHSVSVGSPSHGTLLGGVRLPDSGRGFVHNQERPDLARYGTVELVQLIVRAAAVVERELPGSGLTVNDLGLQQGGPIKQHGSHQAGRDADILFYMLDKKGKPTPAVGVPIEPDGTGVDYQDLAVDEDDLPERIDLRRTWRFVQALLEQGGDEVQRIFLVEHLRAMLLTQAERAHAPAKLRDRFADLTCQPETPHDDHMHVRLFCSPEDIGQGCWDKPPIYPWHKQALHALGLASVLEPFVRGAQRREELAERTTSRTQARKKAGVLSRKVRQFLERREAWAKKPHPGRQYCK
ncbi:MAG: penicillin-insensitive murein endopeptidase [Polyangiales bacterium]